MSDVRPVWLTREQYNMLRSLMQTWPDVAKPIVAAWDAAPADATEAVAEWFDANFQGADADPESVRRAALQILAALRMPEEVS